jgi:hypothetical protein
MKKRKREKTGAKKGETIETKGIKNTKSSENRCGFWSWKMRTNRSPRLLFPLALIVVVSHGHGTPGGPVAFFPQNYGAVCVSKYREAVGSRENIGDQLDVYGGENKQENRRMLVHIPSLAEASNSPDGNCQQQKHGENALIDSNVQDAHV